MRRLAPLICAVGAAAGLAAATARAQRPHPTIVWFAPAPGSLDMLHLFEADDEWAAARSRLAVFKFYGQHLWDPAPPLVGPNTYRNLVSVDAFRTVTHRWHKLIAVEVGSVKPQYCTTDASGNNLAIRDTFNVLQHVHEAGAEVSFLAMDEPFFSGRLPVCDGPDPAPTLRRLERYFANVRFAAPTVRIGLIEPYPAFAASELDGFLAAMAGRGIAPAFFHLDVDINALRTRDTFADDVPLIAAQCERLHIPFGVIITGLSGDSDAVYVQQAENLVDRVNRAFPDVLPQLIFQSWAESRTGLRITPTNLPETTTNTHTWLIDQGLRTLARLR